MLCQFQFKICLFHVFKHEKLCGMVGSNVEMIIFYCDNINIDIKSKKSENFHEKMKFPNFIWDHSKMVPGPQEHQITSFPAPDLEI